MNQKLKLILAFLLGVILTSLFFVRAMMGLYHSATIGQLVTGAGYLQSMKSETRTPQMMYDSMVGCYLSEARWIADTFYLKESSPERLAQHLAWKRVYWLRDNLSATELIKNSCLNKLKGQKETGSPKLVKRKV